MKQNHNYMHLWESHFIQQRQFIISFAFRMTGSLSEAEDLVQDTFIECAVIDPSEITNHKSWLTKVCSNKALDHLKSAYKRRETYRGTWLPDAVPDSFQFWGNLEDIEAPDKPLLLSESLTTSFLLLIEKLTPEERVVYLLSEVFEYSYKEIANFLSKTDETCRKIAQRARQAVNDGRVKYDSRSKEAQGLIQKFYESAKNGDHQGLMDILNKDSELWADGGGKVSAILVVFKEDTRIARLYSSPGIIGLFNNEDYKTEFGMVNTLPGLIISRKLPEGSWVFDTIFSFETLGDKIVRIYTQRNPDKLQVLMDRP
jgi:RNA polymerase sigma-70 factor (ECF subfamily)